MYLSLFLKRPRSVQHNYLFANIGILLLNYRVYYYFYNWAMIILGKFNMLPRAYPAIE